MCSNKRYIGPFILVMRDVWACFVGFGNEFVQILVVRNHFRNLVNNANCSGSISCRMVETISTTDEDMRKFKSPQR